MRLLFRIAAAAALATAALAAPASAAKGPFDGLAGLWSGQGRLGFKDGKVEAVTCRTTYFVSPDSQELKQNIRCASGGAKIEVKSIVRHAEGKLAGTWEETVYNKSGEIGGEVTPKGFRVTVKGSEVDASMDIIVVKDARQIIEIHFNDSTLLGLTLVLTKGTSNAVTGSVQKPAGN
jgi:hypothetical protein